MNNKLIRFWFKFENNPIPLNFGCGVTAFNDIDALTIIKEQVFKNKPFPEVAVKIENIDINTLDQGHIIPNMYSPNYRGIWFPIGFQKNKSSV